MVSESRKALASSGVRKYTRMALGALVEVGVMVLIRWISSMLGWVLLSSKVKALIASSSVLGCSVSQNRKRLSGKLRTKMVVSSARGGGGRSLR